MVSGFSNSEPPSPHNHIKKRSSQELCAWQEEQARKDGLEEAEPSAPSIDPSWTRIGRVVAERLAPDPAAQPNAPLKGGKAAKRGKTQQKEGGGAEGEPQYLIKWAGLPYEDASWEAAGDLAGADFERELAKMRARVPICQAAQVPSPTFPLLSSSVAGVLCALCFLIGLQGDVELCVCQ